MRKNVGQRLARAGTSRDSSDVSLGMPVQNPDKFQSRSKL